MNDFTKKELKELHSALCDRHEDIEDFVPTQPLRIKIQSMIDNYCEHAPDNISHSTCPLGTDMTYKCKKCGRILNDNQGKY